MEKLKQFSERGSTMDFLYKKRCRIISVTSLLISIILLVWAIHYLQELRNCIWRICHLHSLLCSIWVYTSLHFLPLLVENKTFDFLQFLFSAFSLFRFHLHKLYSIYVIIVYKGAGDPVILFPLYKKLFVITNIALWKFDYNS